MGEEERAVGAGEREGRWEGFNLGGGGRGQQDWDWDRGGRRKSSGRGREREREGDMGQTSSQWEQTFIVMSADLTHCQALGKEGEGQVEEAETDRKGARGKRRRAGGGDRRAEWESHSEGQRRGRGPLLPLHHGLSAWGPPKCFHFNHFEMQKRMN